MKTGLAISEVWGFVERWRLDGCRGGRSFLSGSGGPEREWRPEKEEEEDVGSGCGD